MNKTTIDRVWQLGLILLGCLFLLFAIAAILLAEVPGETVQLQVVWRDSDGYAANPTTLRGYVYNGATCVDSSATLAGGTIARVRGFYRWSYALSSGMTTPARLHFRVRGTDATHTDWIDCQPATIEVGPTIANGTIASLQSGTATANFAWVSESSYINGISGTTIGQITKGGSPVTGAFVFATSNSNGTGVIGYALSSLGDFDLVVPHISGVPETIYISAWYQNAWLLSPTAVVLP